MIIRNKFILIDLIFGNNLIKEIKS